MVRRVDKALTKGPAQRNIRWTRAMRAEFLDHLAATCNVKASAEAIGVPADAVYRLRRRDDSFSQEWGEALALGYQMLETHVVGHLLAGQGQHERLEVGPNGREVQFADALKLLTTYRNASGKPVKGSAGRKFAAADETDKALLAKLKQIESRAAVEGEA